MGSGPYTRTTRRSTPCPKARQAGKSIHGSKNTFGSRAAAARAPPGRTCPGKPPGDGTPAPNGRAGAWASLGATCSVKSSGDWTTATNGAAGAWADFSWRVAGWASALTGFSKATLDIAFTSLDRLQQANTTLELIKPVEATRQVKLKV